MLAEDPTTPSGGSYIPPSRTLLPIQKLHGLDGLMPLLHFNQTFQGYFLVGPEWAPRSLRVGGYSYNLSLLSESSDVDVCNDALGGFLQMRLSQQSSVDG